jgi:hypothetical protein
LKGVIAAVTPSGPRSVKASTFVATFGVFIPARWTGRPQANSTVSMPRVTSANASGNVLPWSRVMSAAISSRCRHMSSRKAKNSWLRAMSGMSRQAGKAAAAALTALSTSAAPPRGTRPMTWPVAGLYTGPVCSGGTSTGRPSIQWDRMGSVAGCTTSVVIGAPPLRDAA